MWTTRRTLAAMCAFALSALAVDTQSCYYYGGMIAQNNQVCEGSSTCCGPKATCESYKLCHNVGDPADVFVRGPCATMDGWGTDNCPSLCQYNETTGVFPRVKQCPDQSWCCSNKTGDAVADDVKDCCAKGQGTFINALGDVVKHSTSLAAPTKLPTATTTAASQTASPSASKTGHKESPTADSKSSSGGLSTGAKAGIGAGVGVGAVIVIGAALLYVISMRRSRRAAATHHERSALTTGQPTDPSDDISYGGAYAPYKDVGAVQGHDHHYSADAKVAPVEPVEAPGTIPGQMHNETGRHEMADNAIAPQELEGDAGWKGHDHDTTRRS